MSREFLENLELCVVEETSYTVRRCQLSTGGTVDEGFVYRENGKYIENKKHVLEQYDTLQI